jgi:hypothetical protein
MVLATQPDTARDAVTPAQSDELLIAVATTSREFLPVLRNYLGMPIAALDVLEAELDLPDDIQEMLLAAHEAMEVIQTRAQELETLVKRVA